MTDHDRRRDALARELRARIGAEVVDISHRRRVEYSSDASNYRVLPEVVVFPRGDADVAAALELARSEGVPFTARGGGTSVAGNAVGPGIVCDFSRYLNGIAGIDPQRRTARVQPGVVLAELQRRARAHGLRFGPDPSTQDRCTLGGMIGNNACGPHAIAWGRTSDQVRELRILDGTGTERRLAGDMAAVPGLPEFTGAALAVLRTDLGRFDRQASGYGLEYLLPERGSSVAGAFAGTEGTCGVLLEAEVDLVPIPAATLLVVLGYEDLATAGAEIAAGGWGGPGAGGVSSLPGVSCAPAGGPWRSAGARAAARLSPANSTNNQPWPRGRSGTRLPWARTISTRRASIPSTATGD
uniref:FAD-binding oxidoreductase n=1 Tax=Nocardia carnea TaxID=37328 RepID=UPI002456F339